MEAKIVVAFPDFHQPHPLSFGNAPRAEVGGRLAHSHCMEAQGIEPIIRHCLAGFRLPGTAVGTRTSNPSVLSMVPTLTKI
jgi:hypothetical protein